MTISLTRPTRELVSTLRAELRTRRENRAAHKALERELGSYRTAREVDDLLGTIQYEEGPEADQVREFLLGNLRPTPELYRIS